VSELLSIRNTHLNAWADACEALRDGDAAVAELAPLGGEPLEPYLKVTVRPIDGLGHLSLTVEITPMFLTQWHSFKFGIDQTHLPQIARMCRSIVGAYPIRG